MTLPTSVNMRRTLVSLGLCTTLAGCHTHGPRNVISAIPTNTSDAVFVSEYAGLTHEAARHNLSVYWNGPNRGPGISMQIALVQRAMKNDDFGLVLSPVASFALDTIIQRALAKGLPVVILGPTLPLAPNSALSFVSSDPNRTAVLAAQRIHKLVGDEGEIGVVGIDPMEPGSTECARDFEAALKAEAPHVHITSRLVRSFSWGQSGTAIAQALVEHPRIRAIYALNLNDVRAAVNAIGDLGRESQIKVVGNNQALDILYHMRHGQVDALVIPDMRHMGEQAVRNITAVREHRYVNPRTVFEPVLVTRENLDTEAMQQRLALDWKTPS